MKSEHARPGHPVSQKRFAGPDDDITLVVIKILGRQPD